MSASLARQLALPLPILTQYDPDALLADASNAEALAWLGTPESWPQGRLALFGPPATGKSHMLRSLAQRRGWPVLEGPACAACRRPAGGRRARGGRCRLHGRGSRAAAPAEPLRRAPATGAAGRPRPAGALAGGAARSPQPAPGHDRGRGAAARGRAAGGPAAQGFRPPPAAGGGGRPVLAAGPPAARGGGGGGSGGAAGPGGAGAWRPGDPGARPRNSGRASGLRCR